MDFDFCEGSDYRGCRDAKEETRKRKSQRAPKTTTGRVFSSSHTTPGLSFAAVLRRNAQQQPQPLSVAQACTYSLEANPKLVSNQSVQAPNANSSSLNEMFIVVPTTCQQILTKLNGAESKEDRIMAITKTVLKLMKQNGR
jgi:hypothetical protein